MTQAMHQSDLELATAVVSRDRAAFESFFSAYFSRVYRFCRSRMSDTAACEDVVQETMLKAVRNLHTYRGEAALFTWLCQICRNEMSNWQQRTGRKMAVESSIDEDAGFRAALESLSLAEADAAEVATVKQLVQLTLDHLPDRYGRVLEWKYLEGLSVGEIAARMATGETAVQSLLARARRAFRSGFEELRREAEA